jgi:hypothetical protein
LGGELATAAADLPAAQLIARAQQRLAELLPGITLRKPRWGTVCVDRAEAAAGSARQLAGAHLAAAPGWPAIWLAWPGKLTLAPDLADKLLSQLHADGVMPSGDMSLPELAALPVPALAKAPWELSV